MAKIATRYFSGSRSQALVERLDHADQRALHHCLPVPGSTEDATSAMPRYGTHGGDEPHRRSAAAARRRPIATWPARPDDASMPLNATSTSGNANTRSPNDGDPATCAGVRQHVQGRTAAPSPQRHEQQLEHEVAQYEQRHTLVAPRARPRGWPPARRRAR